MVRDVLFILEVRYYIIIGQRKKLDHKYSAIQNGEKIKFCYLKTPNWMHENVISFIQDFPTELDLHKHVDYDLQFSKAFLDPIKLSLIASVGRPNARIHLNHSSHDTLHCMLGQMTAYFLIDK